MTNTFGANSGTGVVSDVHSDLITPLEQGDGAMRNGTIVLSCNLHLRQIAHGP